MSNRNFQQLQMRSPSPSRIASMNSMNSKPRLRTSMAYATTPSPLVSLGADELLPCPSKCRSTYLSTNAPLARLAFVRVQVTCVIQWGSAAGWLAHCRYCSFQTMSLLLTTHELQRLSQEELLRSINCFHGLLDDISSINEISQLVQCTTISSRTASVEVLPDSLKGMCICTHVHVYPEKITYC